MHASRKAPGKTRKTVVLFFAVTAVLPALADAAGYSGGTGAENDPYQIAIAEDWSLLTCAREDWDKYFVLSADIDFAGALLDPVGDSAAPFAGVFDGNGRVLRNARILLRRFHPAGLFGVLEPQGKIMNLGVESISVAGHSEAGGLAGINCGAITACRVSGRVQGSDYSRHVGGLVGNNDGGAISSCHTAVDVAGGVYCQQIGGLAGYNTGIITASYAEAGVNGDEGSINVGGLTGCNDGGTIMSCYAQGGVHGGWCVGGLIGANQLGTVTACYATGAVKSDYNNAGGLVGLNRDAISACYAAGPVQGIRCVGGLVGRNDEGVVTACFWNLETSGRDKSAGGRGLLSAQMGRGILFQNAGWNGYPWVMREGAPPRLAWEGMEWPPIPKPKPRTRPGRQ